MGRRVFSREFKLEAVKQIIDRGVSAAQVARDIEVHLTLVNRWVREHREDTTQAFPERGQMRSAEADVLRQAHPPFQPEQLVEHLADMIVGYLEQSRVAAVRPAA